MIGFALLLQGAPVPWQGAMLRLLRTSQLQGHNARYGKTAARCTTWEFSWAGCYLIELFSSKKVILNFSRFISDLFLLIL